MTCETDLNDNFEDQRNDSACQSFVTEWLENFPIWKTVHEYELQDLFILFGLINRVAIAAEKTTNPEEKLELSKLMLKLLSNVNDWARKKNFLYSEIVRCAAKQREFEADR
ncbi:hypothetical protein [Ruegeria sp. R14_0]|uniref:hypothetical protein n=1 Tax=Ruegeria sp. R14_0 TaxID=2821100 RepID=UPI001ADD5CFE|nr:hypothetical protein [Ruegeria sp. R14_0]MBO9445729.1 hypothetical protein [Ruegeria sp. R14_0]